MKIAFAKLGRPKKGAVVVSVLCLLGVYVAALVSGYGPGLAAETAYYFFFSLFPLLLFLAAIAAPCCRMVEIMVSFSGKQSRPSSDSLFVCYDYSNMLIRQRLTTRSCAGQGRGPARYN